jgi:hypothetical protein
MESTFSEIARGVAPVQGQVDFCGVILKALLPFAEARAAVLVALSG